MEDLISIIIPVYKVKEYIHHCMETVLAQTYCHLEIILVDDGSPDECGEICDEYARMDLRVKVIHKENGGLSSARNAALAIASGEYIGFVDSDDYIHPKMYELLHAACVRNAAEISVCSHFVENGERLYIEDPIEDDEVVYTKEQALERLLEDKWIRNYAWDKLYRADIFKQIRYPEGRNHEDVATTYLLFDQATKICKIPDYLYYYQLRDDSISGRMTTEKWFQCLKDIMPSHRERCQYFKNTIFFNVCQKKLLDDTYAYIDLDNRFNRGKGCREEKEYLAQHKNSLLKNNLISDKNKKLLQVYLLDTRFYVVYYYLKNNIKKIGNINGKVRSKLLEKGIISKQEIDFSLRKPATKRLIFFELPDMDNLGDHAISYAQAKLLGNKVAENPEYQLFVIEGVDTIKAMGTLRRCIKNDDVIVLQGGGNFGNLYEFADVFRKKILQAFPKNRIVIFPQTCYFTQDEAGRRALKEYQNIISKCNDITLYARDHVSYKKMVEYFKHIEIKEARDIVSSLDLADYASDSREGIILCLRSDKESALPAKDKKRIMAYCEEFSSKVIISDTVVGWQFPINMREDFLKKKWTVFGKAELVVTDRLHGMIFAMLTKTPCIILGNNHHKVRETYKTFQECDYLFYAETVECVYDILKSQKYRDMKSNFKSD